MYRCECCQRTSEPGQPRLTHNILREDGTILREVPVCKLCRANLQVGLTLEQVKTRSGRVNLLPLKATPPKPLKAFGVMVKRGSSLRIPKPVQGGLSGKPTK